MAYSCDYLNDCETYSTNEVKTNKVWIDGKPIYRVVIILTSFPDTNIPIPNYSSIDKIVDYECICCINNNNFVFKLPDVNSSFITQTICYITNGEFIMQTQRNNVVFNYGYTVIEYTKTTD